MTNRGVGADTPIWSTTVSPKGSDSSSNSTSEGDSGLGSNPSVTPRKATDTAPPLHASLIRDQDAAEDALLSGREDGDGDQEMADAEQPEGEDRAIPTQVPQDSQEEEEAEEDRAEVEDQGNPPESPEPTEPIDIVFRGFRTVSQTLSEAYGHACGEIEILLQKSLAKSTHVDRNMVFGALRSVRTWIDCVKPAMALSDQDAGKQTWLLAEAWQAGKDALDHVAAYIPEDGDLATLMPVYPKTTTVLAWKYTDSALWNVHTQLSTLIRENVPSEQSGSFLNTVLELTCSFRQEMNNLATSQVLLPSQLIQNIWGGRKELLEGLSLMGPPSCLASWPASMVEWVTAVPAPKNLPGSCTTLTKSDSGVVKGASDSGKKQLTIQQASAKYWGSKDRGKEDEEARKQEEKHRKKSAGPTLSLAKHKDAVGDLVKWHAPSRVTQPATKVSTSGAKDRTQARLKHPIPVESDNEPLSDEAEEPKTKSWRRVCLELILIPEDDSPLPPWAKVTGKKHPVEVTDEEGLPVLNEHLKAEVRATQ